MRGRSCSGRRGRPVRTTAPIVAAILLAAPLAAVAVPPAFGPQAYLKASVTSAFDEFGSAVAIDGDTLVVGAAGSNAFRGAAFVFVRDGARWSQQARLEADTPVNGDAFGTAVAIAGDTLVVGAPGRGLGSEGSAVVFVRSDTTWTRQAELVAAERGSEDSFGTAVAVHGDTIVVGAPTEDSGDGSDPTDDTANAAGAAYVFVRDGTPATWTQQAYLKAEASGIDPFPFDLFGNSVDVHEDTVVVGAPFEDTDAADSGAVFVFTRTETTWSPPERLKASDAEEEDGFGEAVALHRDTLVVGASNKGLGSSSVVGAAYVFVRSGTSWLEQALLRASDATAGDQFGFAVAVDADTVVVGAKDGGPRGPSGVGTGTAAVFVRTAGAWAEVAQLENASGGEFDSFGRSVAVSGDTALVGAPYEDSGAIGVDGDAEDGSTFRAGAAFVFVATDVPPEPTPVTASGPTLAADPATGVPGRSVRALVSGADPGIAFLWRLTDASGAVLADGDVTVDGSGAGEFAVPVPRTATGALTLELVDWGVRTELVVGGPVPTAVAAGTGPGPQPTWLALGTLLVTSALAAGLVRGRRRAERGSVGDTPAW